MPTYVILPIKIVKMAKMHKKLKGVSVSSNSNTQLRPCFVWTRTERGINGRLSHRNIKNWPKKIQNQKLFVTILFNREVSAHCFLLFCNSILLLIWMVRVNSVVYSSGLDYICCWIKVSIQYFYFAICWCEVYLITTLRDYFLFIWMCQGLHSASFFC